MIQRKIAELLDERGPLTGGELYDATRIDRFELWRECLSGRGILARAMGRRYMRLDERLPGYARLSPSILREFLTYTAVGLAARGEALCARLDGMASRIARITERKKEVARAVCAKVGAEMAASGPGGAAVAFILAGDVAYGMAHEEPRPERSTGRIVSGSDIDLVALVDDSAPDDFISGLDAAMHREKYAALINPLVGQEVDYVVKRASRAREQMAFDSFKRMVACKILDEGILVHGDQGLFADMKEALARSGVPERLGALRRAAEEERSEAVALLSGAARLRPGDGLARLFYSSEESDEFE